MGKVHACLDVLYSNLNENTCTTFDRLCDVARVCFVVALSRVTLQRRQHPTNQLAMAMMQANSLPPPTLLPPRARY